jgi:glycolate oxidase FAD binding subunit
MQHVRPTTVDEVASAMRDAASDGLAVMPRGAGTKRGWGPPPRACDLVVDLSGLDRIVDHAAGDMVVQVEAGVPLDRLAAVVAEAGQQLAVDAPSYEDGTTVSGTVGGALAVAVSGPRRLRYGALRDLLLGVTMVRADGVVASSGGRVVKNVAGYDLGKLLTGSYGTLGVIVGATLRLHPLPAAVGFVTVTAPDAPAAYSCAEALHTSQLVPSAVELDRSGTGEPITIAALFEGTGDGVAARAAAAAELIDGDVTGAPDWFGRWPGSPTGTLIQVATPPAALVDVLGAVAKAAEAADLSAGIRGSTGVAALQVGLPTDAEAEAVAAFVSTLRAGLVPHEGTAVVVHSPATDLDWWGPADSGALALMRRVKDQFDPDHRLSPGRFVGGI